MLKKNFLISLVVIQGLLIIGVIIAIIFVVFHKMSNSNNFGTKLNNIDLNDVYLLNENQYQQKFIKDNKAIFQIIDFESNKVLREIIIEKN
tara:strand:- start:244 stop:516 length:273 start_codon:yes stop_codon:yes gene_type:complete